MAETALRPLVERVAVDEVRDLILIGQPLRFAVLDVHMRLLLNEGQQISSVRQIDQLIERGAWVDRRRVDELRAQLDAASGVEKKAQAEASKRELTLFDRWERVLWDLDALLRGTSKGQAAAADWHDMVVEFCRMVDCDTDVAIFSAVRQADRRFALYPIAHSLHAAVLGLMCARMAGMSADQQFSIVGAALSMNVAMVDLQAHMAEQDTPPTKRQLEAIRAHPAQGLALLQQTGLTDAGWLAAVIEHHEHTDGSGYPQGSTAVCEEARVLRMADVYMAKITPRAKRPPLAPMAASRQLFQQESGAPLAMAFVKAIGVHPPGSLVQLKSGEVALVTRRSTLGPHPEVRTLSNSQGQPKPVSKTLNTADPAHSIVGPCADDLSFIRVPPERVYGLISD